MHTAAVIIALIVAALVVLVYVYVKYYMVNYPLPAGITSLWSKIRSAVGMPTGITSLLSKVKSAVGMSSEITFRLGPNPAVNGWGMSPQGVPGYSPPASYSDSLVLKTGGSVSYNILMCTSGAADRMLVQLASIPIPDGWSLLTSFSGSDVPASGSTEWVIISAGNATTLRDSITKAADWTPASGWKKVFSVYLPA